MNLKYVPEKKKLWFYHLYLLQLQFEKVYYSKKMYTTMNKSLLYLSLLLTISNLSFAENNLDYNFYFVSRQKNKKFLDYWTNKFNIDYKKNLKVSDKRYWICNSTKFNCCQVLAYDEQYKIPFRSEHVL